MNNTPTHAERMVARWLLICCALVFAMVVLGGVTRLTGSGLSMTEWKPVTGFLPPIGEQAWQEEFERYQASPEFRKVNSHMGVADFKNIFWLEFLHRLLGRIIGIAFFVPFLWFAIRRYIPLAQLPKYGLMFVLGGLQGVLGWYMVKSGLVDNPQVSQYRLTAHLVAAILVYSFMLWVALSLLYPGSGVKHGKYGVTLGLTSLIAVTVLSGGFVAGLKAGKIYNTFPLMGEQLIPPGLFAQSPWWRNFFENTTTVQFDHRLLAISTFLLIVFYYSASRHWDLPRRGAIASKALLHTGTLQVVIGISTLLMSVPVVLGAAHQGIALMLLTVALVLCHSLRYEGIAKRA